MPDFREITITISDDDEIAHVWTNISRYCNRLVKLGAVEIRRSKSGTVLHAPAAWFWPRKRRAGIKGTATGRFLPKPRSHNAVSE